VLFPKQIVWYCQYCQGRMGQCPERAEHRIDRSFEDSGYRLGYHRDFIMLCDGHLGDWFDDQEEK
jgi:hypothetical protein